MTEMDVEDRRELSALKTEVATLQASVTNLAKGQDEIKDMIRERMRDKPTNWIGIGSLILAGISILGSFVWLFLNMRLTPMESRLADQGVALKENASKVLRDQEWAWENQRLSREHTEKLIDRMWDRVFSGDPPKFVDKPKP